jgi:hypothetical protein
LQPIALGSTALTPVQPAGFVAPPAAYGSVLATFTQDILGLTDNVAVGQNLQIRLTLFITSPAPAGGLHVTLTSNNPAALRLSTSATATGSASIPITIPQGQTTADYYLQAFSGSGSATYTASAPAYPDHVATVPMTPSGIVILGPLGTLLPFFATSLSAGATTPLSVQAARLDPATNSYLETQQLAAGQTLNLPLTISPSGIGSVPATVTLTGGNDTAIAQFTPLAVGQTIVSVTQPAGFIASNFISVTGIVNP